MKGENTMENELFYYIAFFGIIFMVLLVQYVRAKKRREKEILRRVREQWGKVPDREYTLEEFEKISHYYSRRKEEEFSLDDTTWNDLGMDDVFLLLNTAGSSVGEEYLYRALRTPEFSEEKLRRRSELADYFRTHEREREAFAAAFARMGRKKRIALSDDIERLPDIPKQPLFPHVLALAFLAGAVASFAIRPSVGVMVLVAVLVFNLVTYYKYKGEIEGYFRSMSQVADLVEYGYGLDQIQAEDPVLLPYKKELLSCCKVLKPVRDQAWILVERSSVGGSIIKVTLDYLCMITHLDLILFRKISVLVKDKGETLERLLETMGQLELGLCIGSYREFLGTFCEPEFHERADRTLVFSNLYHPLIENAVPNSLRTDKPVLVTGSNASGKSTFLKTVGVNAVLAQTINTVAAERYETDFFRVYSSMALSDNLEGGESYYMAEIRSLKRILDAMEGEIPVLCFIDEVLRGTNTVERISASSKVLFYMTGKNVLPFAATHDIELTRLLDGVYANYHFEEQVEENDVWFSYKLEKGPAGTRNAIRLLRIMGYDETITSGASAMAERFVETGEWRLEP